MYWRVFHPRCSFPKMLFVSFIEFFNGQRRICGAYAALGIGFLSRVARSWSPTGQIFFLLGGVRGRRARVVGGVSRPSGKGWFETL